MKRFLLRIVNMIMQRCGYTIVPTKPTDGLLISMAIRYDQTFGLNSGNIYPGGHTPDSRKRLIDKMKLLHEEVVGLGCYDPAREDYYTSLVLSGWTIPFNSDPIVNRFPR